ncbi:hypothetical protein C8F04DRAFT_489089 [Mycena alexandri]|uniref:DUF6534 domain-containing protein n=1 Tax=Mycena alexandri TaxID=1745969 RepID=A0AAD6SYJ8_9AGAR|nr:hypothetical protein C8F04DRAFT_489089 [Mycena alexandri]
MAPLPNVQLSYGPMLVGVFFNMILYGVFVGQVLTYYQLYRKDDAWMRYFVREQIGARISPRLMHSSQVAYLFVLETANTGLDIGIMYQPLILEYGRIPVYFPLLFPSQPLIVVLVSTPIQIFFAWRIRTLTKMIWVPIVISTFAVAALTGGLWTTVKVAIIKELVHKPELHNSALLWFLASCVADILITISLVLTLSHRKTGFVSTDSVIDKIIRTTIQTGMVTSIFSILDVICFMVFPHYSINFVWDLALSKLYSNCLLSTLNARAHFNISTSRVSGSRSRGPQTGQLVFEDMALAMSMGVTPVGTKFDEFELAGQDTTDDSMRDSGVGTPLPTVKFDDHRADASGRESATETEISTDDIVETPRTGGFMLYTGGSAATRGLSEP